ncbi:MAG: hypothetical protein GC160_27230 [Acidobacteria bacterium]|nr:hypothetical protein [Acidobacteriota bacterium]
MAIPNVKNYTIQHPQTGERATVSAVLPKGSDVKAYLADAAGRFDWKAWSDQKATLNKVRVGQQKQVKRK